LSYLLPRQLDEEGAKILKRTLTAWGIGIVEGVKIREFSGKGIVKNVVLDDGTLIPAEMVLLSTGIRPNTDFLEFSHLPFNKGALVDSHMSVADDIFAAGDIAEFNGIVLWYHSTCDRTGNRCRTKYGEAWKCRV